MFRIKMRWLWSCFSLCSIGSGVSKKCYHFAKFKFRKVVTFFWDTRYVGKKLKYYFFESPRFSVFKSVFEDWELVEYIPRYEPSKKKKERNSLEQSEIAEFRKFCHGNQQTKYIETSISCFLIILLHFCSKKINYILRNPIFEKKKKFASK
jgi:hypothetical protein